MGKSSRPIRVAACISTSSFLRLNTPRYVYTTHFTSQLINAWVVSAFQLLWVALLQTFIHIQVFVWKPVLSPLGYLRRNDIAGSLGNSMSNFPRNGRTVPHRGGTIIYSHQRFMRLSISLYSHQHLLIFWIFLLYPSYCVWNGSSMRFWFAFS